jgi:hypothetical protein
MLCCERWTMSLLVSHKFSAFIPTSDRWLTPPANKFCETSRNDDSGGGTGRGLLPVNPCLPGWLLPKEPSLFSKGVAFLTGIEFNHSMSFVYESWSQNTFTGLIFSGVSTSNRNSWDLTVLLTTTFPRIPPAPPNWGILHIVGRAFSFPVHNGPSPVFSGTASQLFAPLH